MLQRISKFLLFLFQTFLSFHQKNGFHMAAGSTFYLILGGGPLLISILLLVTFFIEDQGLLNGPIQQFFQLTSLNESERIKSWMHEIIQNNLRYFTYTAPVNSLFVLWAGTGFLSSLMKGLNLLTHPMLDLASRKRLKSFILIGVSIFSLFGTIILSSVFTAIGQFIADQELIRRYLTPFVFHQKEAIDFFIHFGGFIGGLLDSTVFHFLVCAGYFTLFFFIIFERKVLWKEALQGSLLFSFFLVAGKAIFNIYLFFIKDSSSRYFGSAYSIMVPILWLNFLMIGFYFAVSYISRCFEKRIFQES